MEMKFTDRDRYGLRSRTGDAASPTWRRPDSPCIPTGGDMEMSGMGFTVMESFSDKVLVESEPGVGDLGDFDQVPGHLL